MNFVHVLILFIAIVINFVFASHYYDERSMDPYGHNLPEYANRHLPGNWHNPRSRYEEYKPKMYVNGYQNYPRSDWNYRTHVYGHHHHPEEQWHSHSYYPRQHHDYRHHHHGYNREYIPQDRFYDDRVKYDRMPHDTNAFNGLNLKPGDHHSIYQSIPQKPYPVHSNFFFILPKSDQNIPDGIDIKAIPINLDKPNDSSTKTDSFIDSKPVQINKTTTIDQQKQKPFLSYDDDEEKIVKSVSNRLNNFLPKPPVYNFGKSPSDQYLINKILKVLTQECDKTTPKNTIARPENESTPSTSPFESKNNTFLTRDQNVGDLTMHPHSKPADQINNIPLNIFSKDEIKMTPKGESEEYDSNESNYDEESEEVTNKTMATIKVVTVVPPERD